VIVFIGIVFSYAFYLGENRFLGATSTGRRIAGLERIDGEAAVIALASSCDSAIVACFMSAKGWRVARGNSIFLFLEGNVMQSPPSIPARPQAKFPQQLLQGRHGPERAGPGSLSGRVGEPSALLLERPLSPR
jgi:hypothetical protein